MSTITAKINLAKLPHVLMNGKGKSGPVEGIFIPITAAKLFKSEKGNIYLDIVAFELKEKKYEDTHIVKQSFSKDERDKMSEEQQNNMPILGNMKLVDGFSEKAPVENAAQGSTLDPEDDLPF